MPLIAAQQYHDEREYSPRVLGLVGTPIVTSGFLPRPRASLECASGTCSNRKQTLRALAGRETFSCGPSCRRGLRCATTSGGVDAGPGSDQKL
jgi:hypothetical protein